MGFFSISAFLPMAAKLCIASEVYLGQKFLTLPMAADQCLVPLWVPEARLPSCFPAGIQVFSSTLFLAIRVL